MAKILIVDDNPSNRSLLVQFLGYCGHSLREAVDGAEALALISTERPDLVITDILMPTMDGYELVRRLRSASELAHTPVIFWTAHFRERDARDLAKECGVEYVLTKPCDLVTVRQAVDDCLSQTKPVTPPPVADSFDREHLRLLMDKLTKQTDELTSVNLRLEALIDASLRLASETDSTQLLEEFGKSARELISAKFALVGIVEPDHPSFEHLSMTGVAQENFPILKNPRPAYEAIAALLPGPPKAKRFANLGADPSKLGFPENYPTFASLLAAPIASPDHFYGWLCLFHRLGALEFSEEDERLAGILGALAGRIYESGRLYANAQHHASEMEREVGVRTRAEEALRSSEARYRLFFEDNPLPGWLFDLKTLRFLDVNRAAVAHYGYTREEFLSMSILDIRPPSQVAELMERLNAPGGADQSGRWKHRKKDGTIIDVEVISHSLEGTQPAVFTLAHDVTDRIRSEAAVQESTERLNLALATSRTGVWTWDAVNDHSVWDENTHQIYGIPVSEFGGKFEDMAAAIHPDDRESMMQAVTTSVSGPADFAVEFRVVWPDDSIHYVASRGRAFFDESGALLRVIGVSQDVTEQRRLTEQLRQSQKMEAIGQLAGGIAHDFNNVLNVILGYSKLLLANSTPHDPAYKRIDEIRKAGERAAALTQQLLAFSRKQVLQPRVVSLAATLTDMDQMVRRIIGEHIEVVTRVDENLGQVKIDPNQAHQVILNLVVNARDAMAEGGSLTLEVSNAEVDESAARAHGLSAGRYVMLAVSDNGCGMTPDIQQRVFEPFFTTKGPGQGTGLGMATVYGIVQQSGGHIWLYSEPGIGTTFKIFLPRVDEPAESQSDAPVAAMERGEETVLVVEDDPAVRGLVEEILGSAGYHVIVATNGDEAIRAATELDEAIHLLLTDVVMPNMGGREVAERIKQIRPSVKVLFMSGYTGNAIAQHGTLDPGVAFIQKPFTPESLCGKVRAVLNAKSGIRRVMVVDDDMSLRNLLAETLQSAGFQTVTAENGKKARAEAARNPVDLVITDLAMPEEEGLEMIRLLKKEQPNLKIVAMSGAFDSGILRTAQLLGAHASLTKPLSTETILRCIDELS